MHAARLGYQGLELLETGELTLPMQEPERSRVMAIRTGERTFEQAIAEIEQVEAGWRRRSSGARCRSGPTGRRSTLPARAYRHAWGWGTCRGRVDRLLPSE